MRDHFDGQHRRSHAGLAGAMHGPGRDHITETSMEGQVGRIEPAHQLGASIVAERENGIALKVGDLEVTAMASLSFTEPPGWTIARMPARPATSMPSG